MRHSGRIPQLWPVPRHGDHVGRAHEGVGDDRVGRVEERDALDLEMITVDAGRQRRGVDGPDAVSVLVHSERLGDVFYGTEDGCRARVAIAERDGVICIDLSGGEVGQYLRGDRSQESRNWQKNDADPTEMRREASDVPLHGCQCS